MPDFETVVTASVTSVADEVARLICQSDIIIYGEGKDKHPALHLSLSSFLNLASVLRSWEDDDKHRYYPLGVWTYATQRVLVVVRDGCFGTLRGSYDMTLAEAVASGMSVFEPTAS